MKTWAIVGAGYVGQRLASRLLRDRLDVTVTSRRAEGRRELIAALPGAQAICYSLGEQLPSCSRFDTIVICAPPGAGAPTEERALAEQLHGEQRLVYLSTTGVYAAAGGAEVGDDYRVHPGSERSMRRLRVEEALSETHANTVCLRVSGIYGPHRGVHARMRRGDYRLIGEANTLVSRIYVEDLVDAIVLLGTAPSLAHQTYVVGDEKPTTATEHARGVAERLSLPMPKTVDPSKVSAQVRAMLGADRRVVARRLGELGWRAKHPTWREGLEAALAGESES